MISYKKLGLKSQRGEVLELRAQCLKAARMQAPKDTGNMRYNAIYSMATKNGFKIVWDDSFAYYLPFVNEGKGRNKVMTNKQKRNYHFVDKGIASVQIIATAYLNGDKWQLYELTKNAKSIKNLIPKTISGQDTLMTGKNLKRYEARILQNAKHVSEDLLSGSDYYAPEKSTLSLFGSGKKKPVIYDIGDFENENPFNF